jgi:hypothetical protein
MLNLASVRARQSVHFNLSRFSFSARELATRMDLY